MEPLNVESNVFFLLATWADRMLARRAGALSPGVRVPIALGASVGVGSILWHTYPTMPTLVLDSVPILVFISWFIWLYTRNVVGMRPPFAAASVAVFLLANTAQPGPTEKGRSVEDTLRPYRRLRARCAARWQTSTR